MEAVLGEVKREALDFSHYVWSLWAKAPTLMWFTVLALDAFAVQQSLAVH